MKCQTIVFDGGNARHEQREDIGVLKNDRKEDIRRISLTFISPEQSRVRQLFESEDFIEVYCQCPREICEGRDVKGIYQRARAGEIHNSTGIFSPYEEPKKPELVANTGNLPLDQCANQVISRLHGHGIISSLQ